MLAVYFQQEGNSSRDLHRPLTRSSVAVCHVQSCRESKWQVSARQHRKSKAYSTLASELVVQKDTLQWCKSQIFMTKPFEDVCPSFCSASMILHIFYFPFRGCLGRVFVHCFRISDCQHGTFLSAGCSNSSRLDWGLWDVASNLQFVCQNCCRSEVASF